MRCLGRLLLRGLEEGVERWDFMICRYWLGNTDAALIWRPPSIDRRFAEKEEEEESRDTGNWEAFPRIPSRKPRSLEPSVRKL
jgi:hypothetical protein